MELFEVNKVDILLLQETWVRKCDASVIEQFKEFGCEVFTERKPRKNGLGGGVAIVFTKNLKLKKCKITKLSSF